MAVATSEGYVKPKLMVLQLNFDYTIAQDDKVATLQNSPDYDLVRILHYPQHGQYHSNPRATSAIHNAFFNNSCKWQFALGALSGPLHPFFADSLHVCFVCFNRNLMRIG
eukprot:scaffold44711_cov90-Cyclotella_meneghiniana.AAC.4